MRQQTAALWDGRLASEDCGDAGVGIDDAEAGEAKEAARKVACPLFLFSANVIDSEAQSIPHKPL